VVQASPARPALFQLILCTVGSARALRVFDMAMEQVECRCAKCEGILGQVVNLWTRIGRTYCCPVLPSPSGFDVLPQGNVRVGETGTLVEQW